MGTIKYAPFGQTRSVTGIITTDKKFTGQELDDTGLYYYNARYYDPTIGRFISADTVIPNPANPQGFNRYAYCLNNPGSLKLKPARSCLPPGAHVPFFVIVSAVTNML